MAEWLTPDAPERKDVVEGVYQPGGRLRTSVPGIATLSGVVRCEDPGDWAGVCTLADQIRAAFRQRSFTITETTGGRVTTYTRCQPTGLTLIGGITADKIEGGWGEFSFSIDYHPNVVEAAS